MGGDRINYPEDCGTPTADMTLFKIMVNSIISTPNAKCLMLDIKDFYLKGGNALYPSFWFYQFLMPPLDFQL